MGFIRVLSDAIDKNTVQRAWGSAKKVDWQGWAERNGWTYQAEAPELANRWWQDFDGIEEFHHLMTTTLHDLPVTSFQHISHAHMGWGDDAGRTGVYGHVVVRLPAPVAEPYASQPMYKTLRHFGVIPPPVYNAWLQDLDLIAARRGFHHPKKLQQEAELFALYITMAPPEFWRR